MRQDQQAVIGNPVQSQEADIGSLGPGAEAKAHGRLVQVGRIPDRDRNRLAVEAGQGRQMTAVGRKCGGLNGRFPGQGGDGNRVSGLYLGRSQCSEAG
ncbi:hypothetical protein D3C87_1559990 [compost metagenome]